ncbi:MAG: hypothetical protein HZB50_03320 [Chloroflexi bacterium]|nr:hypothetical protein [Chloroflexota bacterium]
MKTRDNSNTQPLEQQTIELIVDVLTFIHAGKAGYEQFVSEQVVNEAATIRKRYQALKKQGVPGIEAVRQAKVEWILKLHSG